MYRRRQPSGKAKTALPRQLSGLSGDSIAKQLRQAVLGNRVLPTKTNAKSLCRGMTGRPKGDTNAAGVHGSTSFCFGGSLLLLTSASVRVAFIRPANREEMRGLPYRRARLRHFFVPQLSLVKLGIF
jgi:hypothetical protein